MAYLNVGNRKWPGRYDDPIPTAVVAPILRERLYAYKTWRLAVADGDGGSRESPGTTYLCELVSRMSGEKTTTWQRRLNRILSEDIDMCSISQVDHFLVALECHYLWYVEPLSDYYFACVERQAA